MSHSNESNIHDFDFSLICEYFSSVSRQGQGSDDATLRALSFLPPLGRECKIADMGCGTGSSTMVLSRETAAEIVGLDLFPDFLTKLSEELRRRQIAHRVTIIEGDMGEPPFAPNTLDVVWCEGAIYNIGFERGLTLWRELLKADGYVAVSEACWLTDERPQEIAQFWQEAYPAITTIEENISKLRGCGYRLLAAFVLPKDCWTTHFYEPAREAQHLFLDRHHGDPFAEELVRNQRREAELYERYHDYYGYVFFVAQKSEHS